jgi:hypothetical protein
MTTFSIPIWNDLLNAVGSGRIEGGWEFVWTVYGLTWTVLGFYALSLWIRRPRGTSRGSP